MGNRIWYGVPAALISTTIAGTAWADVTPEEVWASWQALTERMGYTLAAESETRDGNMLTLTGITSEITMPEGDMVATIGEVTMTDRGDGTVGISISEDYTLSMAMDPASGAAVDFDIAVTQSNLSMIASGTPDAIDYDYSADSLGVAMGPVEADGEAVPVDMKMDFGNVVGDYRTSGGDVPEITSNMTADTMSLVMAVSDPDGNGALNMNVQIADIAALSEGALPMLGNMTDLSKMVAAGLVSKGGMTHGAATYDISFADGSDSFDLAATADGGRLDFGLSGDGIDYAVGATGLDVTMSGSEIPFPQITFAAGETLTRFAFPVVPSDEATPFATELRFVDFSIGEQIWAMIDPAGVLPRDPATVVLDLSGMLRLTEDIFAADAPPPMGPPGEVDALELNALEVSVAGASLTGSGSIDVDNTQPGMAPGMPKAVGAIDLQLVGGNGLIDKLVQMGLLPEDQAMGARMMMGLFARPGDGADTLVSKIEITEDGGILANGQRIQ